jgi:putative hydrolase of HD superfamily
MKLEGEKLILRDWIAEDLADYAHWIQPHQKWHDLDGPYYRITDAEAERMVLDLKNKIAAGTFSHPRMRLVIADKTNNKLLGTVAAYWESKETNWLCIGLSLYDPSTWGKGFGHEALTLWIDYLFQTHTEIVRLDLRTWSGNIGMMKLAVKLGFQQEACFRKARIVNGQYFDGLGYGILKEEWFARK